MTYVNESVVANALSKKYPSPQYAFLRHVRNQTGYSSSSDPVRTADCMALGLWATRGHHLEGFEIKVTRQDWLKEWKDPSKAEAIAKFCDFWWIVEGQEGCVNLEELPHTWGLKRYQSGHIVTIKQAVLNQNVEAMTRSFLCGFLRNIVESIESVYTPTEDVEKIIEDRTKAGIELELTRSDQKAVAYDKLVERVKKFQEITGIDMSAVEHGWWNRSVEELANAVNFVKEGKFNRMRNQLEYILMSAKGLAEDAKKSLANIPDYKENK